VLEEEHVMATAMSEDEDKDVPQTGMGGEAAEDDSSATLTVYQRGPVSLP
jgi:hypothetical protein